MMDYYSNTMQQTVDETHMHSASVEKSHLQGYILFDSMYAAIWKSQNYMEGKKIKQWFPGAGRSQMSTTNGYPLYTSNNYKLDASNPTRQFLSVMCISPGHLLLFWGQAAFWARMTSLSLKISHQERNTRSPQFV